MAVCSDCRQEMTLGVGCTSPLYEIAYAVYERIPNGDRACHDCMAPAGTLHHPGCDSERCPICRGQAISCGCGEDDDDGV